jgi:hypothetical protein
MRREYMDEKGCKREKKLLGGPAGRRMMPVRAPNLSLARNYTDMDGNRQLAVKKGGPIKAKKSPK